RLGLIDGLQRGQPGRAAFRAWAIQLVRPQLQRLGWEGKTNEPSTDTLLRNSVISLLGNFGDKEVISTAQARFQKFIKEPESWSPGLRIQVSSPNWPGNSLRSTCPSLSAAWRSSGETIMCPR